MSNWVEMILHSSIFIDFRYWNLQLETLTNTKTKCQSKMLLDMNLFSTNCKIFRFQTKTTASFWMHYLELHVKKTSSEKAHKLKDVKTLIYEERLSLLENLHEYHNLLWPFMFILAASVVEFQASGIIFFK